MEPSTYDVPPNLCGLLNSSFLLAMEKYLVKMCIHSSILLHSCKG